MVSYRGVPKTAGDFLTDESPPAEDSFKHNFALDLSPHVFA